MRLNIILVLFLFGICLGKIISLGEHAVNSEAVRKVSRQLDPTREYNSVHKRNSFIPRRTNGTSTTSGNVVPDGDTYNAGYFSISNNTFLYLVNTELNYTFGISPESAGVNGITNAPFLKSDFRIDLGGGKFRIEVHFYSGDGSDMLPFPVFVTDGGYLEYLVMEVGMAAAGTDPINLNMAINVTLEETIGYINGTEIFDLDGFVFSNYSGDALRGITILQGVSGIGLNEIEMAWTVSPIVPTTTGSLTTGRPATGSTTGAASGQATGSATGSATGRATGAATGQATGQNAVTATTQGHNGVVQLCIEVVLLVVCILMAL